jgi:protein-S-isoprenylcysteine O-methyltransferase Ste14
MNNELKAGIVKRIIQVFLTLLFQAGMLFISSGRLNWLWGWVFIGMNLVGIAINAGFMFRLSPETIAERSRTEGMKSWDKVVGGLWAVIYFIVMLLVAGLDERFGWTAKASLLSHIAGCLAFVTGWCLFSWALIENAYFSTVVRIQDDRGQTVCTTGPYRMVRHPGYIGAIFQTIGIPFLMGSAWALIPAAVATILMIIRTQLEDRTLHEELQGYKDYAKKVRFRVIPGIW